MTKINLVKRLVVDAPIRMFHWLFAICFIGAYITGDSERDRILHVSFGYTLFGLLLFRVAYAFWGAKFAKFSVKRRKLGFQAKQIKEALKNNHINRTLVLNVSVWLTILSLLVILIFSLPLVLTGYATYNEWNELLKETPFFANLSTDWLAEWHEFFGNLLMLSVVIHVATILLGSLMEHKNLALPMLTGHSMGKGIDLPSGNRWPLAYVVLVLAMSSWLYFVFVV